MAGATRIVTPAHGDLHSGSVPITACQWAWIHSDGGNDFLLTATATMTTPAFGDLNDDVLAIIMSLEVRNA